jgi:hypothetical protein
MENVTSYKPRIRRVIKNDYTLTIAYVLTDDGTYIVGFAFGSNLDNPKHSKGREIALGRFYKNPIALDEFMYNEEGERNTVEQASIAMLEKYLQSYIVANKPERIALEKASRFPRWLSKFLAAWFQDSNLAKWSKIVGSTK